LPSCHCCEASSSVYSWPIRKQAAVLGERTLLQSPYASFMEATLDVMASVRYRAIAAS